MWVSPIAPLGEGPAQRTMNLSAGATDHQYKALEAGGRSSTQGLGGGVDHQKAREVAGPRISATPGRRRAEKRNGKKVVTKL